VADPRPDRMMTSVVAAAEGAGVDVVLVRPDKAVSRRPLPPNVTTTDWLPFADVLPHVAGIIHHGGAGTTMTALAAGVPQIAALNDGYHAAFAIGAAFALGAALLGYKILRIPSASSAQSDAEVDEVAAAAD